MFAQNILDAGNSYLDNPMETPFIPSWTRVNSAIPGLQQEFISAVTEDMNEFSK
jgi:glucosyl-3-phosphoglycerate synthase